MFPKTAVEWLEKLVAFDTTSRNSNMEIVRYLDAYLKSVRVATHLTYDGTKTKANLFATIPGRGNTTKGGIIMSGHLDCVPVDNQKWDTDPFKATPIGNRIYGRGTCDMKGFIAVVMALVPGWLQQPPPKPVHLAWTYDEEVGCLGGRVLTKFIKERGVQADGCIVGEPTSNKIVVAHKGISVWRVTVTGKAAHSSRALTSVSCNAIDYAARLIVRIGDIAAKMKANGDQDKYFDVPFTTMSTNQINGGIALNTVPEKCVFIYEFRNLPTMSQESILKRVTDYIDKELRPRLQAEYPEGNIVLENVAEVPHMPQADEADPFVTLVRTLRGSKELHKIGCTTEAGQYALIGVPVLVCGPGSLDYAHQPNEFVPVEDLAESARLLQSIVAKHNGAPSRL